MQKRLFQMFGAKETAYLYFATECKTVNGGLEEQFYRSDVFENNINAKQMIICYTFIAGVNNLKGNMAIYNEFGYITMDWCDRLTKYLGNNDV